MANTLVIAQYPGVVRSVLFENNYWKVTVDNSNGTTTVYIVDQAYVSGCQVLAVGDSIGILLNTGSNNYVLPIMSATELGGAKVGAGLVINPITGVLDVISALTPTAVPCGSDISFNGGQSFPTSIEIGLGSGTGVVTLKFDAYSVPDKFILLYEGAEVINTGYRGASYNQTKLNTALAAVGLAPETIAGIGNGSATFNKTTATATATLLVYAPIAGTRWDAFVSCPGGDPGESNVGCGCGGGSASSEVVPFDYLAGGMETSIALPDDMLEGSLVGFWRGSPLKPIFSGAPNSQQVLVDYAGKRAYFDPGAPLGPYEYIYLQYQRAVPVAKDVLWGDYTATGGETEIDLVTEITGRNIIGFWRGYPLKPIFSGAPNSQQVLIDYINKKAYFDPGAPLGPYEYIYYQFK